MNVFSKEYLDKLRGELQLVNLTLKHLDETRPRAMQEYGVNNIVQARSNLYNEKIALELKITALHQFLTE